MAKDKVDGNISVLLFEDQVGAENMLDNVYTWQEKGLLQVIDAVVAVRGVGRDVEIRQTKRFAGKFAGWGTGAGLLVGMLLGGPIGGMVVGAAAGGIMGAMRDYGIDDKFINQVTEGLGQNTSALFLLTTGGLEHEEELLAELRPHKARLLSTSLDEETAARLRSALDREE